jgi:hypothetical protein
MPDDNIADLINALPGSSPVNAAQHATIQEAVFSMSSASSSCGTTGLCNPCLSNGLVNTFLHIRLCYESGDVINNRDGVFRTRTRSGMESECTYF